MPQRESENRIAAGPAALPDPSHASAPADYGQRKRAGAFFTPWPVACCLAERGLALLEPGVLEAGPRLCDPFVGQGILLNAAASALGDLAPPLSHRLGCLLHGADLDPALLAAAGAALPARARLCPVDTLLTPTGAGAWREHFPEAMEAGGFDLVLTNPPWEKLRVNDREFFARWAPDLGSQPRPEQERTRARLLQRADVAAAYAAYRARIAAIAAAARGDYATSGSGGDLDAYKLAVERSLDLTRPGGIAALIVPHGLLGDWGARRLRAWLLERHAILEVDRFETGPDLFPEIHANLGVVLLFVRRGPQQPSAPIRVSRAARTLAELRRPSHTAVPLDLVRRATPHAMLPLVEGACDLAFLDHCRRFPSLAEWPLERFRPRREVDMTLDRAAFRPVGLGVPLLEGKHLQPFKLSPMPRQRDVDPRLATSLDTPRIAWRAVADRAMRRRLVAAWVPAGVALGNSLIATSATGRDAHANLLWLLAWLNSRIAEAQLRLWSANNNINIHHLRVLRAPERSGEAVDADIVRLSAGLTLALDPSVPLHHLLSAGAPSPPLALARLDELWRLRYDLPPDLWEGAVLSRTAPVALPNPWTVPNR